MVYSAWQQQNRLFGEEEDEVLITEAPPHKRSKQSSPTDHQEQSHGSNQSPQGNLFSVPLGLQLRKSASLLQMLEMKLSHGNTAGVGSKGEDFKLQRRKNATVNAAGSSSLDKLKASNFAASLLRIGSWQYVSKYEGDLVAKCYFAKHKLVWEVLEGGLKSKIEIQWAHIVALKAYCPPDAPGTLTVVLKEPPLFYRETNPQPRKHTLWQASQDFTHGQASKHRQHFLECPPGVLDKHYEKLIQCDTRLDFLSQQSETVLESPYFVTELSILNNQHVPRDRGPHTPDTGNRSPSSGIQDMASPSTYLPSSYKTQQLTAFCTAHKDLSKEAQSSHLGISARAIEGNTTPENCGLQELNNVPRLQPSMSFTDLVNHIGHRISEQRTTGNLPVSDSASESQISLETIAQHLLSDTQLTAASDENRLMSKVNSLLCLLQDPPLDQLDGGSNNVSGQSSGASDSMTENDVQGGDVAQPGMSRDDSFAELVYHLPRIASLPNFLYEKSEDGEIPNP